MSIEFNQNSNVVFKHHNQALNLRGVISKGSIHALQGPSGCGKSTLLRSLAQIETPSVPYLLSGSPIADLDSKTRKVSLVFQKPLLFPHLNVLDNILFPLKFIEPWSSWSLALKTTRALDFLREISLEHLANALPKEISGGESMRVSLVRSLVSEPHLLLLDEPFSGLDNATKEFIKEWLKLKIVKHQIPTLFVSHIESDFVGLATQHHQWPSLENFSITFS